MASPYDDELSAQMAALGKRIKQAREFRRLTLHVLARQADIGLQTLVRMEDGNPNVGMLNLYKVMRVLGLSQAVVPAALLPVSAPPPAHARTLDTKDTERAIRDAARAACASLDAWLQTKGGATLSGHEFERQLRATLSAMLQGRPAPTAVELVPQLYSDVVVGGPLFTDAADCVGWVLKVRGEPGVIQGGKTLTLSDKGLEPYPTRGTALTAFLRHVEKAGHPPGPVEALPVFVEGDGYRT